MASTVPFKLVTPTQIVFEGDAELVIAVTTEGEEGILPRHAPFLAALRPGVLRANVIRRHSSEAARSAVLSEARSAESKGQGEEGTVSRLELATSEGFMQALPDRVTVLVDEAVRFEEVVVSEVRDERDAAIERQKAAGDDRELYAREQAAIEFADAKLRLTGHR